MIRLLLLINLFNTIIALTPENQDEIINNNLPNKPPELMWLRKNENDTSFSNKILETFNKWFSRDTENVYKEDNVPQQNMEMNEIYPSNKLLNRRRSININKPQRSKKNSKYGHWLDKRRRFVPDFKTFSDKHRLAQRKLANENKFNWMDDINKGAKRIFDASNSLLSDYSSSLPKENIHHNKYHQNMLPNPDEIMIPQQKFTNENDLNWLENIKKEAIRMINAGNSILSDYSSWLQQQNRDHYQYPQNVRRNPNQMMLPQRKLAIADDDNGLQDKRTRSNNLFNEGNQMISDYSSLLPKQNNFRKYQQDMPVNSDLSLSSREQQHTDTDIPVDELTESLATIIREFVKKYCKNSKLEKLFTKQIMNKESGFPTYATPSRKSTSIPCIRNHSSKSKCEPCESKNIFETTTEHYKPNAVQKELQELNNVPYDMNPNHKYETLLNKVKPVNIIQQDNNPSTEFKEPTNKVIPVPEDEEETSENFSNDNETRKKVTLSNSIEPIQEPEKPENKLIPTSEVVEETKHPLRTSTEISFSKNYNDIDLTNKVGTTISTQTHNPNEELQIILKTKQPRINIPKIVSDATKSFVEDTFEPTQTTHTPTTNEPTLSTPQRKSADVGNDDHILKIQHLTGTIYLQEHPNATYNELLKVVMNKRPDELNEKEKQLMEKLKQFALNRRALDTEYNKITKPVVPIPEIENFYKLYKSGIMYLKINPSATENDLLNDVFKKKQAELNNRESQIQQLLLTLNERKHLLDIEYNNIVNSGLDDTNANKYKTIIAFLKLQQNNSRKDLLEDMMKKKMAELESQETELKNKLKTLSAEYKELNAQYKAFEAQEDKDKVVVAVIKMPVKKGEEKVTEDQMKQMFNSVKTKLAKEHNITDQSIRVIDNYKDNYNLSQTEKDELLSRISSEIKKLTLLKTSQQFNIQKDVDSFHEIFYDVPQDFLTSDNKIFGENPYQGQNMDPAKVVINPTQSLLFLRHQISKLASGVITGKVKIKDEIFLDYLIKILNLLTERLSTEPSNAVKGAPQVSVYTSV